MSSHPVDPDQSAGRGAAERARGRVLYVSYDGMLEPLGESQVVSYVERLAADRDMTVVSFEKEGDTRDRPRVSRMRARLTRAGVAWMPLRYHKTPPVLSTIYDVLGAVRRVWRLASGDQPVLVHARGYVSSLVALALKRWRGAAFLFDMRGFWIDEKVEAGHWRRGGPVHRMGKRWERVFFEQADAIVSLTHEGVRTFPSLGYAIRPGIPIAVIPTCADLNRFRPGPKDPVLTARLDLVGATVIGTVGTLINWYLRAETLSCLALLVRNLDHAKVLIVTREDHAQLRSDAERHGIDPASLVITRADFDDMPTHLRLFDLGVFFIRPCFSKKGSAATKLAEFLASGVPVLVNDGVGDSGAIVGREQAGLVLPDVGPETIRGSLVDVRRLLQTPHVSQRCRAAAESHFDLEHGVTEYGRMYDAIFAAGRSESGHARQ